MAGFTNILVATDFGKPAARATQLAAALAEAFGAKLTLLFVFSVPPTMGLVGGPLPIEELRARARKTLDAETARLEERLPGVTSLMRTGSPWEEILQEAKELGADLIVLGTHGRQGLPRALIGSVAERVLRMASIPVLTVAAAEGEA
ncbi:MAG TPA: universal stress protein [Polyangiaceae bacterium]|nr:universal stress protein [Polyangiaceae bacterium]